MANRQVSLDPEVYDKVKALADREERTVSKQATRMLREALLADTVPGVNPTETPF